MSTAPAMQPRRQNPVLVVVGVVAMTVGCTILGFAVGGLLGIVGVSLLWLMGSKVEMTLAIAAAVPAAGCGAVIGLAVGVVLEWRARK